jgi:AraC-like DNA-binding protein
MIYRIYKPGRELQSYIHFYWILEMDAALPTISEQRIIPNACTEAMFHFGDRLCSLHPGKTPEMQPRSLISGQSTAFYDVQQTGKTGLLSIVFKPHAARLFFNIPAGELTNRNVDLEAVKGLFAKEITEKIALSRNNEARIQLVEDCLLEMLQERQLYNFRRISAAIEAINSSRGNIDVGELASLSCLSYKQFDRVFLDLVGLHPKTFMRIVRMQYVFHHKKKFSATSLTQLAYDCGYYDQAHFINDFKTLTGYTPGQCFDDCRSESDYFLEF